MTLHFGQTMSSCLEWVYDKNLSDNYFWIWWGAYIVIKS
jgi:hypothetical protein